MKIIRPLVLGVVVLLLLGDRYREGNCYVVWARREETEMRVPVCEGRVGMRLPMLEAVRGRVAVAGVVVASGALVTVKVSVVSAVSAGPTLPASGGFSRSSVAGGRSFSLTARNVSGRWSWSWGVGHDDLFS